MRRGCHEGQVLIIYAIALIVLLGFAALSVDVGFILAERRGVQNAADAAAMAAGRHVARTGNLTQAEAVGLQFADANGYGAGDETEIDIVTGVDRIEIEITHEVQGFFLRVLYTDAWELRVRSAAIIQNDPGPFAMIALGEDPNCHPSSTGIRFSGLGPGAGAVIMGGSIGSNSCVRVDGNPPGIAVDGNVEAMYQIQDRFNSIQIPQGAYKSGNMNRIGDPFGGVVAPVCSDEGERISSGNRTILTPGSFNASISARHIYLTPGVYCFTDQIQITGNGSFRSVDLEIDEDVDLDDDAEVDELFDEIDAEPVEANGGVLLYFTGGGRLQLGGGAVVKLRSAGFLPSEPGNCSPACDENFVVWMAAPGCRDFVVRGNAANVLYGVVYAPCSEVSLGGTSNTATLTGMVVADSIEIFGNATFNLIANNEYIAEPARVFLVQ